MKTLQQFLFEAEQHKIIRFIRKYLKSLDKKMRFDVNIIGTDIKIAVSSASQNDEKTFPSRLIKVIADKLNINIQKDSISGRYNPIKLSTEQWKKVLSLNEEEEIK